MLNHNSHLEVSKYPVGVAVGRFQIDELHEGHVAMLNTIIHNHKKVIVFLGVPAGEGGYKNPLDFQTREMMIKELYPSVIVLPLKDNRLDDVWSRNLDTLIDLTFGEPAILYGSRDSFLPHYSGKHETIELMEHQKHNGTEQRNLIANLNLASKDFRRGIIKGVLQQRPITYPTVDIVAYKPQTEEILLAKKPNETMYRFVGGFVDRDDNNWEYAAKREFSEETGGSCSISDLKYIASAKINDWRYRNSESGIMTTLFLATYIFGYAKPSDDIVLLDWVKPFEIDVDTEIMPEHRELYKKLLNHLEKLIK
jgi:bifunctional NMN adenylyltransferase/nudix hydrolase